MYYSTSDTMYVIYKYLHQVLNSNLLAYYIQQCIVLHLELEKHQRGIHSFIGRYKVLQARLIRNWVSPKIAQKVVKIKPVSTSTTHTK